jgi:L-lactate dehydrogenase complex protein LldG
MSSRDQILGVVRKSQPSSPAPLPDLKPFWRSSDDLYAQFNIILSGIGGKVQEINNWEEGQAYLRTQFSGRMVSTLPGFEALPESDPHALADVELCILPAHFAVAENGAIWITSQELRQRASAFIPQHLAVLLKKSDIVPTMHHAYARIGQANYDFGVFIAGPSKTADIEQSLVLGAHGPRTMTVLMLNE